jgi:hypothetical protein
MLRNHELDHKSQFETSELKCIVNDQLLKMIRFAFFTVKYYEHLDIYIMK